MDRDSTVYLSLYAQLIHGPVRLVVRLAGSADRERTTLAPFRFFWHLLCWVRNCHPFSYYGY